MTECILRSLFYPNVSKKKIIKIRLHGKYDIIFDMKNIFTNHTSSSMSAINEQLPNNFKIECKLHILTKSTKILVY